MNHNLFTGRLVQLTAPDAEQMANVFSSWTQDSLFYRLMASDPARRISAKANKEWVEKNLEESGKRAFWFQIQPVGEKRVIGDIGLHLINGPHREAFVGIGIGEREFWGKGYGTDAMAVILRYAFCELNLHRVALDVFEYNPRGIRSYEKLGFRHEGRLRQFLQREGRRWDLLFMGILREEWQDTLA